MLGGRAKERQGRKARPYPNRGPGIVGSTPEPSRRTPTRVRRRAGSCGDGRGPLEPVRPRVQARLRWPWCQELRFGGYWGFHTQGSGCPIIQRSKGMRRRKNFVSERTGSGIRASDAWGPEEGRGRSRFSSMRIRASSLAARPDKTIGGVGVAAWRVGASHSASHKPNALSGPEGCRSAEA